jgi:hypothetical protein
MLSAALINCNSILFVINFILFKVLSKTLHYQYCSCQAVPWLRRLVAGLSPRRPRFDPRSVHVGFVVGKMALGQVFPRVLRISPVNFIPPVLHYTEKRKKIITFITGLHNKPQGCGASVASTAGPFTTKETCSCQLLILH